MSRAKFPNTFTFHLISPARSPGFPNLTFQFQNRFNNEYIAYLGEEKQGKEGVREALQDGLKRLEQEEEYLGKELRGLKEKIREMENMRKIMKEDLIGLVEERVLKRREYEVRFAILFACPPSSRLFR